MAMLYLTDATMYYSQRVNNIMNENSNKRILVSLGYEGFICIVFKRSYNIRRFFRATGKGRAMAQCPPSYIR